MSRCSNVKPKLLDYLVGNGLMLPGFADTAAFDATLVNLRCAPRRAVSSVPALPLWSRQAAFAEELARGPTIAHAATKQPLMGWTDCFSVDYPFAENPPGTKWLESASRGLKPLDRLA